MPFSLRQFASLLLVTLLLLGLALFASQIVGLLFLLFGSILLAILLRAMAAWIAQRTPLSQGMALLLTIVGLAFLIAMAVWMLGTQVVNQFTELLQLLPQAWTRLVETLETTPWGSALLSRLEDFDLGQLPASVMREAGNALMMAVGATAYLILMVSGGLYLAAQPRLYLEGFLKLMPSSIEGQVREALLAIGSALQQWLKAQFITMIIVGVLTTIGLSLIGVPAALALGLLAGLGEFVPVIGAFVTAIPALLAASTEGFTTVIYVAVLYIVVQQVESNLIMPIIQKRLVAVPPALTLFAVVAFGMTFGLAGALLAAPLTVMALVAVQKLYVEDGLGKDGS